MRSRRRRRKRRNGVTEGQIKAVKERVREKENKEAGNHKQRERERAVP